MKPEEVTVGGYYVMQNSGVIRHFYDLTPTGKARYRSYSPYDGDYMMTSHCAVEDFSYRAERKATKEEISRLSEWKPRTEYPTRSLGKALRGTSRNRW